MIKYFVTLLAGLILGGVNSGSAEAAEIKPQSSQEIKNLLKHVTSPQDKIEVYTLWVDSLKLEVDHADQKRLAGDMDKKQYDHFLSTVSHQISKISQDAKSLGFRKLAAEWALLAKEYSAADRSVG
jgi:hypothetical protein